MFLFRIIFSCPVQLLVCKLVFCCLLGWPFTVTVTQPAERSEVVSAFQSEGRWAPHTTRSWRFLGFEEGLDRRPPDDGGDQWLLPSSLDKASEDIIVGILDSGERPRARFLHRVRRFLFCSSAWHVRHRTCDVNNNNNNKKKKGSELGMH